MPPESSTPKHTARKLQTFLRKLWRLALGWFISLVGELGPPGMQPFGRLQAWALRRMGVTCLSDNIYIGPGTRFDNPEYVVLGDRVQIGPGSRITGWETVTFGDDFLSGPELMINTGSHDLVTMICEYKPVTIGARVWCGMRVTICSGAVIGDDAVVGAGALVTGSLPARHLSLGVPCRPVREIARPGPDDPARLWSSFGRARTAAGHGHSHEPATELAPES
jgi:acetyltransferase-like isoleucine patch superfamily enzyme